MDQENKPKIGVVAYTDSSARPNPGFIGIGIHGYTYEVKPVKKQINVEGKIVTDRGYVEPKHLQDRQPVEPTHYFDIVISSLEEGTNNKGEVSALLSCLKNFSEDIPSKLHVLTDSEYVKKGITEWCSNWERSNWTKLDGLPITNQSEWKETYYLLKDLKNKGLEFSIEWVRGHNDILGNVQADVLSVIGMNYSTDRRLINSKTVVPAKDYWKSEIEKHPFINFKRVYFNSVDKFNIAGQYFQADPGGSDFTIGKRIPETGFAIVKLKEPDFVLESVKRKQFDIAGEINAIVMMKLDRIYSKEIYPYIREYGGYSLLDSRGNLNVNFIDRKPVTIEMNPAGLSMRAVETFNHLEEILNDYITFREDGDLSNRVRFNNAHDITDRFYDIETKEVRKETVTKHILKKEFGVGFRDLIIEVKEEYLGQPLAVKVPLLLGVDLLPRNNLKKLEDESPKVYLITWKDSENTIRYATVIECESGVGIWSNYFADRIFLNNFIK